MYLSPEVVAIDSIVAILNNFKNKHTSIISGGHCYENFVMNKELLINVKSLDQLGHASANEVYNLKLSADHVGDIIFAQPGCHNWNSSLYLANNFGVFIPGGSCYSVCLGGHILGGGYGVDSKVHGLTVDYLKGVELVVFDGEKYTPIYGTNDDFNEWYENHYKKHTLRDSLKNLTPSAAAWFASSGGGGGNFGLLTKYYFNKQLLPTIPHETFFCNFAIPFYHEGKLMTQPAFRTIIESFMEYNLASQPIDNKHEWDIFAFMLLYYNSSSDVGFNFVVWGNDNDLSVTEFFNFIFKKLKGINIYADHATLTSEMIEQNVLLYNWSDVYTNLGDVGEKDKTLKFSSLDVSFNIQINKLPWLLNKQTINGSGPNRKFKNQCVLFTEDNYLGNTTDDPRIAHLYDYFVSKGPVPFWKDRTKNVTCPEHVTALWQFDTYGGKINIDPPKNATSNRRDLVCKIQPQIYWDATNVSSPDISYIDYWNSVYFAIVDKPNNGSKIIDNGAYINYPHVEIKEKYKDKWEEYYYGFMAPDMNAQPTGIYTGTILKECKKILDPTNKFNNELTMTPNN